MAIQQLEGDLLNFRDGLICQCVNCMYVMKAGFAKDLAEKYPVVRQQYLETVPFLGKVDIVRVLRDPVLEVANLYAQYTYGHGRRFVNYGAISRCLNKAWEYADYRGMNMYIPSGMCCGLAGGDWTIMLELIEVWSPGAIIVKKVT